MPSPIHSVMLHRIGGMSAPGFNAERFAIYCHVDGSCSLKRAGADTPAHHCVDLVSAVHLAHDLKSGAEMQITVYDAMGKILLQSFG